MKKRILSIDIFRGLTMMAMILVNNPGSWEHVYPMLRHAQWNGCTPTDLIFPFFLFIVGMAIPFALGKRRQAGQDTGGIILKVLRRAVLIFALGLLFYLFPAFDFSNMRIPGVLQRIAVVYLFASLLYLFFREKSLRNIVVLILLVYWAMMTLIPVPGHGRPNLNPDTNLAAWLDYSLMKGHMWLEKSDPEGLLSTLPSIATAILGMLAGMFIKGRRDENQKVAGLMIAGALLTLTGLAWDLIFPINKNLWTSFYVVYTGGLALSTFGIIFWFTDVRKKRKWASPFLAYGSNCLAVYLASGFVASAFYAIQLSNGLSLHEHLYKTLFISWLSPSNASFAWAFSLILIWLIPLWFLFRKKIYIKI